MTHETPIETTNLDIYGNAPLDWSRAYDLLLTSIGGIDINYFLGTIRPDGRPHVAGFGALWFEDALNLVSGPNTQKSKNLAANPNCTVAVALDGIDLAMNGIAERVTDRAKLEDTAKAYRDDGWPAEVDATGEALIAPFSAPSAGTAPWYLYRITFDSVTGVATREPNGATRWRFKH